MATRSPGLAAVVAAMDRIERAMAALADLPAADQATVRAWVAATYPAPTGLPATTNGGPTTGTGEPPA